MILSSFAEAYTRPTGVSRLMEDLSLAASGSRPLKMLGGGNPARIGEMEELWRKRLLDLAGNPDELGKLLGTYDSADGRKAFRVALATLFKKEYGWDLDGDHIMVTNGSQVAMFYLLNLLAGSTAAGQKRRILFPLMPEYVGYADQIVAEDAVVALKPRIELRGDRSFKYFVDLEAVERILKKEGSTIGGICVSRPTNPSGNVLTDTEVKALADLAKRYQIPLITDNAYGLPFPNILFTDAKPYWDESTVLVMSLSKIGLPSVRTGIVIARPELVRYLSSMNAIAGLATGTLGPALVEPLVASGEIIRLSHAVVQPYYAQKRREAIDRIIAEFRDLPARYHESEGAIFLWLWFDDPRLDSRSLYERAKRRDVLVLPGEYFSFGRFQDGSPCAQWDHPRRCIRINYSAPTDQVADGLKIIAEEARSMLDHGNRRNA